MGVPLRKVARLGKTLLLSGVVDLVKAPRRAGRYWSQIATAALRPAPNAKSASMRDPSSLQILGLGDMFPGTNDTPFSLVDYRYAYGDMPLHEIAALCKVVRWLNPKTVFEIGTYLGGTTLQLAVNTGGEVYTLDLPPQAENALHPVWDPELDVYPNAPGIRFEETAYQERIHQLLGDSLHFDFGRYQARMGFVLVDACHHYEHVLSDSRNAISMLSPGGVVFWHDYADYAPGVVNAVQEIAAELPVYSIAGTTFCVHRRAG